MMKVKVALRISIDLGLEIVLPIVCLLEPLEDGSIEKKEVIC